MLGWNALGGQQDIVGVSDFDGRCRETEIKEKMVLEMPSENWQRKHGQASYARCYRSKG